MAMPTTPPSRVTYRYLADLLAEYVVDGDAPPQAVAALARALVKLDVLVMGARGVQFPNGESLLGWHGESGPRLRAHLHRFCLKNPRHLLREWINMFTHLKNLSHVPENPTRREAEFKRARKYLERARYNRRADIDRFGIARSEGKVLLDFKIKHLASLVDRLLPGGPPLASPHGSRAPEDRIDTVSKKTGRSLASQTAISEPTTSIGVPHMSEEPTSTVSVSSDVSRFGPGDAAPEGIDVDHWEWLHTRTFTKEAFLKVMFGTGRPAIKDRTSQLGLQRWRRCVTDSKAAIAGFGRDGRPGVYAFRPLWDLWKSECETLCRKTIGRWADRELVESLSEPLPTLRT